MGAAELLPRALKSCGLVAKIPLVAFKSRSKLLSSGSVSFSEFRWREPIRAILRICVRSSKLPLKILAQLKKNRKLENVLANHISRLSGKMLHEVVTRTMGHIDARKSTRLVYSHIAYDCMAVSLMKVARADTSL